MNCAEKLYEIIKSLKSPKFKNEKQAVKLMDEILSIHEKFVKNGKIDRKMRRRIKRLWAYGLPYNLYMQLKLLKGLEARHIELICNK